MITGDLITMFRFFLGLGFGAILTVYSFAFVGVGHGTYAPMVFTASLVALITNWGAIPALLLGPFLWAFYFLLIPKMQRASMRMVCTVVVLSVHVSTGAWLAIEDPAFKRALSNEQLGLMGFGLLLAITMSCLFYFAARGVAEGKR